VIAIGGTPVACIDVESTGLSPSRDRVVEIAVVRIGPNPARWESLINPGRDPGPSFAHGIYADDLVDAPSFEDVAPELAEILDGCVIAAHNVNFDSSFLRYEFRRLGVAFPDHPLLDTIRAGWALGCVTSGDSRKLVDLCAREGIALENAHTAMGDASAVAELVHSYLALAASWGMGFQHLAVNPLVLPEPPAREPRRPSMAVPRRRQTSTPLESI
jgi:DNA polymerase-3 subunit epsilon